MSGGLIGQPLHGLINSYLPPIVTDSRQNIVLGPGEEHINWLDNLPEALDVAKIEGKPVFIDFTGYTCTNCRWMETNVFEEPEVKKLFNEFIMLRLYTDGGKLGFSYFLYTPRSYQLEYFICSYTPQSYLLEYLILCTTAYR